MNIGRIKELHFFIRPVLDDALKRFQFNDEGKKYFGNKNNYFESYTSSFGYKFFDMGTLIRLASAIEVTLRDYYMQRKGLKNIHELQGYLLNLAKSRKDIKINTLIFQKISPGGKLLDFYKEEIDYDLNTNKYIKIVQEIMANRHLYAHNQGIVDRKYINDIKVITGVDLSEGATKYLDDEYYEWGPLAKLNEYVEVAGKFFKEFPI